ncbi:MAG TPA: serine hydrolase domain-containing protein [Candidatus Acidoferrum sp.]|jgi:CubicO group peptidase (beta-lactamase class C family)|nr:serine hydrolase domain-containing protein [Candidatus Acidoferrum sp.]
MSKLISLVMSVMLVLTGSVAWAQSLPSAKPEQVGLSSERLDRVGQALKGEIAKGKLPGAVALVARKGRVAYFESFGLQDKAGGAPMANDAIFRIYSMTKPLVSVAAIMLMEDGRLVLTDPVSLHLPQLTKLQVSAPKADSTFARVTYQMLPTEREMTIQDLLRHTSGLAYGEITANAPVKEAYAKAGAYQPSGLPFDARGSTPAEQVTGLSKAPLAHQPGTVWEYSLASDVLGRVVEAASGMRLAQFLQQRLFEPLKMPDSGFSVPAEKMRRLAQPSPDNPVKLIDVSAPPKNDSGGAGGVSTAMDYARFSQMLLNGGRLDGARVLSRTSVSLMTSDHLARISTPVTPGELLLGTPGYTFGLGFAVRQGPGVAGVPGSAGEFMWAGFAGTYFWVDPKEELLGVLMTQAPSPERAYYRRLFKQLVYQAITD